MSSNRSPDNRARVFAACELCGTRFLSWLSDGRRYCSRRCYFAARRQPVHHTCLYCGQDFVTVPSRRGMYCSRACFNAGRVSPRRDKRDPIAERLDRFTDKSGGPLACWPWTGGTVGHDPAHQYGAFIVERRMNTAHRARYELEVGPVPPGFYVLHRCDNPLCQNPRHLWVGTAADNTRDMVTKGRARGGPTRSQRGAQNNATRLCDAQVREMRALYAAGTPVRELRTRYGLSDNGVRNILRRKSWRDV